MPTAGDLRCYVRLLRRVTSVNALGETTYSYEGFRSFWAQIVPQNGRRESVEGDMDREAYTHRVTCRSEAVGSIVENDMRVRYHGQDYQVLYWYPNYKRAGYLDFFCELVVENESRV